MNICKEKDAPCIFAQANGYCCSTVCLGRIEKCPTIEPKHGRWEERECFTNDEHTIDEWQSARCSICGKHHTTPYRYYFDLYNYCPNCGAKMENER